ncbi:amino acid ABC transporter [Devosia sp. Leaf420]|uniref:transporter substrate-binding domain-containing protein n=1 Tax=Devosia sp. Leaf420 TaxID=1736374 RepID=UPI00071340D5|nr:transporter substrate-binding domain-containing protein [Devosia sp. Leaf420]KQT44180.1 amino acid ABC transporter [Devosia sp. Leaf420]
MNGQSGTTHWALGILAAVSILAAPPLALAQDNPIRIAIEGQFPPFNYLDTNGKLQGFDVEIADALCAAMKAECEYVTQDWDEMIPGLLDDKYDAIISSMSMSDERRAVADFTERYYDSPSIFITNKQSDLEAFAPDDLAGKSIGVSLATSQEAYAKSLYGRSDIKVYGTSPELYDGLAKGEVDVVFEDKLAAYDWLTNTKTGQCCEFRSEDIKDAGFFGDGAGIAVRKEEQDLKTALNAALKTITEDGTYNMINAKYFPFSIR